MKHFQAGAFSRAFSTTMVAMDSTCCGVAVLASKVGHKYSSKYCDTCSSSNVSCFQTHVCCSWSVCATCAAPDTATPIAGVLSLLQHADECFWLTAARCLSVEAYAQCQSLRLYAKMQSAAPFCPQS